MDKISEYFYLLKSVLLTRLTDALRQFSVHHAENSQDRICGQSPAGLLHLTLGKLPPEGLYSVKRVG